jgi:hypothetical protein
MRPTFFFRSIYDLRPGSHLCWLYETEEEHRALVGPYMRQGLERGEKVLYVVDAHDADTILDYLNSDGVNVSTYLDRGQLSIRTPQQTYLRGGSFDPMKMIALLQASTEEALKEGFTALRVTGEMSWALAGLPGSEKLIEYEARLNRFLPGSHCLAICQYDRRRFPASKLIDVLITHPIAVVGTSVYENFYYIPPDDYLSEHVDEAKLRRWLTNLARWNWDDESAMSA